MLPALFATVVIHWTHPPFQADTSDARSCEGGPDSVHLTRINLYYAFVGSDGTLVYLRSHLSPIAGAPDTAEVWDDPPTSFFVGAESLAGESCRAGITLGVPSVSVPPWWPKEKEPEYDIQGRRVEPGRNGVYFTRHRKRVVVK